MSDTTGVDQRTKAGYKNQQNLSEMKNIKILIAGGSGFIGTAVAEYFGKENDIVILSRVKKAR